MFINECPMKKLIFKSLDVIHLAKSAKKAMRGVAALDLALERCNGRKFRQLPRAWIADAIQSTPWEIVWARISGLSSFLPTVS
jgi:hypothetical protein